jgi:hypothetical protein
MLDDEDREVRLIRRNRDLLALAAQIRQRARSLASIASEARLQSESAQVRAAARCEQACVATLPPWLRGRLASPIVAGTSLIASDGAADGQRDGDADRA